jgi:hypothetical protein
MLVPYFVYSSDLDMEATGLTETSVDSEWTTRRYIPEDKTILILKEDFAL